MLGIYFYVTTRGQKLIFGYNSIIKILIPVAVLDALAYLGTTWGYSVTQDTTSLITVVANAYCLPTVFLAYFLLKEKITKSQILGIVCIVGGIIISSF